MTEEGVGGMVGVENPQRPMGCAIGYNRLDLGDGVPDEVKINVSPIKKQLIIGTQSLLMIPLKTLMKRLEL